MIYNENAPEGHRIISEERFVSGAVYYGRRTSKEGELVRWKVIKQHAGKTYIVRADQPKAVPFTVDGFFFHPNMPLHKGSHYIIYKNNKRIEEEYKNQQAARTLMKAKVVFNKWVDGCLKKVYKRQKYTKEAVDFLVKVGAWK